MSVVIKSTFLVLLISVLSSVCCVCVYLINCSDVNRCLQIQLLFFYERELCRVQSPKTDNSCQNHCCVLYSMQYNLFSYRINRFWNESLSRMWNLYKLATLDLGCQGIIDLKKRKFSTTKWSLKFRSMNKNSISKI